MKFIRVNGQQYTGAPREGGSSLQRDRPVSRTSVQTGPAIGFADNTAPCQVWVMNSQKWHGRRSRPSRRGHARIASPLLRASSGLLTPRWTLGKSVGQSAEDLHGGFVCRAYAAHQYLFSSAVLHPPPTVRADGPTALHDPLQAVSALDDAHPIVQVNNDGRINVTGFRRPA